MVALAGLGSVPPAAASADYASTVLSTSGLTGYWRLGDVSGTVAADAKGQAAGAYVGGPGLGARGALSGDTNTSARFDGVDDELQVGVPAMATIEGWFFWEGGVALMRDATASGGWIVAFDSGGRVAYRVAGTTLVTALATADVRDGWHHVALTRRERRTAFYLDGALAHSGTVTGTTAAVAAMARDAQWDDESVHPRPSGRDRGLRQRAVGRDDPGALRGGPGLTDTAAPAAPANLTATPRLGRVELDWSDATGPDLDGYDVFRATSAGAGRSRASTRRDWAHPLTPTPP